VFKGRIEMLLVVVIGARLDCFLFLHILFLRGRVNLPNSRFLMSLAPCHWLHTLGLILSLHISRFVIEINVLMIYFSKELIL
jgi:hypothetical protein